jgi:hypothetical protein
VEVEDQLAAVHQVEIMVEAQLDILAELVDILDLLDILDQVVAEGEPVLLK